MSEYVGAIPEFCPLTDIPDHFLIILYGIRRSGKTVMLHHMLYEMQERLKYHEVYLFSATIEVNPKQYDFIPKEAQFSDVKNIDYHLRKIVDKQKQRKAEFQEMNKEPKKMFNLDKEKKREKKADKITKYDNTMTLSRKAAMDEILDPEAFCVDDTPSDYHPLLIILDDVVNEGSIRHSPYLNLLAVGGRHLDISVIILSQLVAGSGSVPPIIRTQADMIAVVAQPRSLNERNLIAEQYLTSENRPSSKADGLRLMNAITEVQHRALFISTVSSNARSYIDFSFKYGPVPYPHPDEDFTIGTDDQWGDQGKRKGSSKKEKGAGSSGGSRFPDPFTHSTDLPKNKKGEYISPDDDIFFKYK